MHLQDYNKVSNFSDWVKPVWAVIFNNIYEINLLDKNIVFQIKYDEDFRKELFFSYFNDDMLYIENKINKIAIDVGTNSTNLYYCVSVIDNSTNTEDVNPFDYPLEKVIFYNYQDVKEYLIKMMEKYSK